MEQHKWRLGEQLLKVSQQSVQEAVQETRKTTIWGRIMDVKGWKKASPRIHWRKGLSFASSLRLQNGASSIDMH